MGEVVKYQTSKGEITLTPPIVRKYLVSGQGNVTDQEIMMFMALCKFQGLNPFLREAYLIKYSAEPATIVTGKETFLKRAYKHPKYQGHKTGISPDGKIAWAEVYMEAYQVPIRCEVDYEEYVGRKKDGTVNRMWKEKPHTMLKKVALVQALREALPEEFGGMYSQEEINTISEPLPLDEPLIAGSDLTNIEPSQAKTGTSGIVKGIVQEVSSKSGTKDNKKWTLYGVKINDIWLNTFDKKLANMAKEAEGKEVEAEFIQTEKSKELKTVTLITKPEGECLQDPGKCDRSTFDEEGYAHCDNDKPCDYQTEAF